MNVLPTITTVTPEVTKLLKAIDVMKEESKLFQFLNGLDETYEAQRSQLLMSCPLPSVEEACVALQQEESQKEVLARPGLGDNETLVIYSNGAVRGNLMCSACGKRGHTSERCWGIIRLPKWHYKYKPQQRNNIGGSSGNSGGKWMGNKGNNTKMANNVQGNIDESQPIMMTAHQLDQILKLIPKVGGAKQGGADTDEELDYGFSGMVNVNKGKSATMESTSWIIDSEASDHMTSSPRNLVNFKPAPSTFTITLPTGATHVGDAVLPNGLKLYNVLHVPQFNHKLLSIRRLAQDSTCDVMFRPNNSTIIDSESKSAIGIGELKQGLYYLSNKRLEECGSAMNGQKSVGHLRRMQTNIRCDIKDWGRHHIT